MVTKLREVAAAALSSWDTVRTSFDLAMACIERGVKGDFVECGVFAGAQCAAMAYALKLTMNEDSRRVHLFDSFEGIPEPGPHDIGWTHPKGTSACSLQDVQRNMKQWGIDESLLVYHEGPFADTVPWWSRRGRKIAILRLDCDLYESTRTCLEYLYPLVVPGGWVIVDDFALPGCRKAVDDYMCKKTECSYPPIYFQRPG